MSENKNKGESKLGSNPLGGALDWLDEEPVPAAPKPKRGAARKAKPAKRKPPATAVPQKDAPTTAKSDVEATKEKKRSGGRGDVASPEQPVQVDSTRRGVAAGYRRHTVLMREDQIEQLDRLYALEKLHAGAEARTKKDLVEEAFDLFFESEGSNPRGIS